ncbi:hypothetical protein [Demequina sp. NBRC 110053]|uniref:hypothetical protein n=1 Tax=Demequina sp. NBRC 110053 TaxID=1570342 RepID=UPI000A04B471|nr:hypothetical protein [Demequina sp. NBRC 110053]
MSALDGAVKVVQFGWIVLFTLAIVVGMIVIHRHQKAAPIDEREPERNRIARAAASRGWSYAATGSPITYGFSSPPFDQGELRRVFDVVNGGGAAWPFTAYTFRVARPDPKGPGEDTLDWRVLTTSLPGPTPLMVLSPGTVAARFLGAGVLETGAHDVLVESHAFNDRWRAGADDEAVAHAVLAPTVIAALSAAPASIVSVIIEDSTLVLVGRAPGGDLRWVDEWLPTLESVRSGIPDFVWDWQRDPRG